MDLTLLHLLRCSRCGSGRLAPVPGMAAEVRCDACGAVVPLRDGVVELAPDFVPAKTFGQAAMEWEPVVRIYESWLWRRSPLFGLVLGLPFAKEQALIFEALALRGTDHVLDLACGSGINSRPLARAVPSGLVVGLDLSPAMLSHAARRVREEQIANLLLVHADAMNLPLADGTMDAVNCSGALHLFPDTARALSEIRRVLRPGGRFVAAVARRGEGASARPAIRLAERWGITSWTEADFTARLRAAGFDGLVRHHARRAWMIWSASTLPQST